MWPPFSDTVKGIRSNSSNFRVPSLVAPLQRVGGPGAELQPPGTNVAARPIGSVDLPNYLDDMMLRRYLLEDMPSDPVMGPLLDAGRGSLCMPMNPVLWRRTDGRQSFMTNPSIACRSASSLIDFELLHRLIFSRAA